MLLLIALLIVVFVGLPVGIYALCQLVKKAIR